ncbi:hypothetical protein BaRGS_00022027 [Batillaria attramentaria]|uniref:Uncharacterized protein n=1 Tax=Batillaria attramentaria TaxID=370345 RepID=A0ABD0KHN0_9CAEN
MISCSGRHSSNDNGGARAKCRRLVCSDAVIGQAGNVRARNARPQLRTICIDSTCASGNTSNIRYRACRLVCGGISLTLPAVAGVSRGAE